MRLVLVAVAVVALAGCGPDFSGSYAGGLTRSTLCSDGTGGMDTRNAEWSVADVGDELHITPIGGNCGTMLADISGSTAAVRVTTCPTVVANGFTTTESVTGGSVTFEGRTAIATLSGSVWVSGAGVGTCSALTTGTLTRR